MYDIAIGYSKDAVWGIDLDIYKYSAIPLHLMTGVGNKEQRYKEHLEKISEANEDVLHFMAFIHKNGIKYGKINLFCKCKYKFHAKVIKEYLIAHKDTLDNVLPYYFPDEGYKAKEESYDVKQPSNTITEDIVDVEYDTLTSIPN